MCLAIPGRIVSITRGTDELETSAEVDFGGVLREVSLAGVPYAEPGQYVIVHAGFALTVLREEEAVKVLDCLSGGEKGG